MRYGIFSDVHSNVEALESVISALKKEKIDEYISGGDIIGYGAGPGRCIEMTKKITGNVVCGNHDRGSVGLFDISSFNPFAMEAVLWTGRQLEAAHAAYLKSLQLIYKDDIITVVHGSLYEPEEFHYVLNEDEALKTFSLMKTPVCFIGHSHIPVAFRKSGRDLRVFHKSRIDIDRGAVYIVNVGSVGQPRDGDPRACYAVFDTDENYVEIKRVPYDIKMAQQKIRAAGLPPVLADRLSEGR